MPRGRSYWRSTSITARGVAIRSTGRSWAVDHQVLAQDLDRVDGGGDRGVVVDLAGVDEDPVLEVVIAAAFADPRPAQVHRDRAAEHEVDLRQVVEGDDAAVLERALDRRRLFHRRLRQLLRVEDAEGVRVAQPRHRHDHRLALFQGDPPRVRLRRVGVGLDRPRPLPERGDRRASRPPAWRRRSWGSAPRRPGSGRRPRAPSPSRPPCEPRPSCAPAKDIRLSVDKTGADAKLQGREPRRANDPNAYTFRTRCSPSRQESRGTGWAARRR